VNLPTTDLTTFQKLSNLSAPDSGKKANRCGKVVLKKLRQRIIFEAFSELPIAFPSIKMNEIT
jgi:hypothetical protein